MQAYIKACGLWALRLHHIKNKHDCVKKIIAQAQEHSQKSLSVNTVRHAFHKCRLKGCHAKTKPYATMIQKRCWAKAHLKWSGAKWKTVLWSGQSKLARYLPSVQKPAFLMVWGCVSAYGIGSLHV